MSRATTCPQIVHDVQSYKIIQERPFTIPLGEIFNPKDGSLKFYLKKTIIPWLHLDQNTGELYGFAPNVPYTKRFKFTLTAVNEMGFVTKSFILVVVDTEIVETMPQTLEFILSLRKKTYGYSHLHPYTPSILEYLFYFFQQPEYLESFEKSVHETAQQLGVQLSNKISYHEFDSLMKQINPDIEKILQEHLDQDHVLTEASLNNEALQNLFREGSQPQGAITVPIWNYCANPNFHNWPHWQVFSNVLHAAADTIRKQREENLHKAILNRH